MRNTRLFGTVLLTLSLGCFAGYSDAQATIESSGSRDAKIRKFSGQQGFLAALSAEVARLKLKDVQVHRTASGKVVGVTFRKKSDIAKALRAVGGPSEAFKIADKTVTIRKLTNFLHKVRKARSATADANSMGTAALSSGLRKDLDACDQRGGDFCTYNSTTNDHYTIFSLGYHHVSSRTMVTRGGRHSYYPFYKDGSLNCNPGDELIYYPVLPPEILQFVPSFPSGETLCLSGEHELSLTNFYFADIDGRPQMIRQEFKAAVNSPEISLGHTTFGKFVFPCQTGACAVNGICAQHSSSGTGGSTIVMTAAGRYDCE